MNFDLYIRSAICQINDFIGSHAGDLIFDTGYRRRLEVRAGYYLVRAFHPCHVELEHCNGELLLLLCARLTEHSFEAFLRGGI